MRNLALIALLALLSAPARADFNEGVVALMMGNYEGALQTFVPLAQTQGHAYAQYFLGRMYAEGQGVEADPGAAAEWYRKAAEQGVGDAQYRLGELYETGRGVPADLEYAYGWYGVATHLGNAKAEAALTRTRDGLSKAELVEAEKLSREFIREYGVVPKSTARQQ